MHKPIPTLGYQQGIIKRLFLLFLTTVVVTAAGAFYLGHWVGFRLGSDSLGETAKAYHKLKSHVDGIEAQNTELKDKIRLANQERDASLNNMDEIRDNLTNLQLREEFLLTQRDAYRSMLPNSEKIELKIYDQTIKPLPENAFEYRFDLLLMQPKGKPTKNITVDITLIDGEAIVRVPLEKSRYDIDGFKRIQGRFIMPEGFTPKQLKIVISGAGENVVQYYNWQQGKPIKNMPQGLIDVPELQEIDIS